MLKETHPFAWDDRIYLDEATHTYYVDGATGYESVSSLWGRYFKKFDADACVDKYFDGWASNAESKYHCLIKYIECVESGGVDEQKQAI